MKLAPDLFALAPAPTKDKWKRKREWNQRDRAANPEKYRAYRRSERERRGEFLRAKCKDYARKCRLDVIAAYGGRCQCCGESTEEFLTIDHVNGGGNQHRKRIGRTGGQAFYLWLKREGFPKGEFRLLCYNCNLARGKYGYCPHERAEKGEA